MHLVEVGRNLVVASKERRHGSITTSFGLRPGAWQTWRMKTA